MRMRKWIAVLLIALALLGLTACGAKEAAEAVQTAAELAAYLAEVSEQETEAPALPEQAAAEPEVPAGEAPQAQEPETPTQGAEPEVPAEPETPAEPEELTDNAPPLDPEGSYTTKEAVAQYLYYYGELPRNFITKKEARALGWSGGGLDPYAPGKSIGGDRFGNYEGLLPEAPGREYHECDIDTMGASSRGAKRIVYSNDGLIYYTDDHYESFTLLYPED